MALATERVLTYCARLALSLLCCVVLIEQRLIRDFKKLQKDPPSGISGSPVPENIMRWNAVIFGPENSPWDGGTFRLVLEFSEDYPNKAPVVRFVSDMFHPNSKCLW